MNFSKSNILNGIFILFLSAILFMQTIGFKDAFMTEGVHPMTYPRALIILLTLLGFFIAFTQNKKSKEDVIPVVTPRTISMCLSLIFFGIIFEKVGFAISAFFGMITCGLIMGYRRYLFLICVCAVSCTCIWILFTYALKIILPSGTMW